MKILFLEDEPVLARVYSKHLEAAGYTVRWVKNVDEVEDGIHTFTPDIFLLDHGISGQTRSGLDVVSWLREQFPQGRIFMLSNYSDFQLREKAIAQGANDYFVKINTPPKVLIKALESLSS